MFLTTPTFKELQELDLPVLLDMLVIETSNYTRLLAIEGFTGRVEAAKENIMSIQLAIEAKRRTERASRLTPGDGSFLRDSATPA
jgi:hypothetical protein